MTLDEAIKHAEEVADRCEYVASRYDMIASRYGISDSCESRMAYQEWKCAEEHRQLAAWLKELKELKDRGNNLP